MALDFPNNPNVGDTFETWQWDGTKWMPTGSAGGGGSSVIPSEITSTEIGYLDGVTSNIQDQIDSHETRLDVLDTAVASVANSIPAGVSSTEIGYLDGVTSKIQDQLDTKVDGTGTANYIPKWSDSNTLGDSLVQVGTNGIGINGAPAIDDVLKIHSGGRTLFTVLSNGAVGIAGDTLQSPIPIDSTPIGADLHVKSFSSSILRITSLSGNIGFGGGDSAIHLENANTDGTDSNKRWSLVNDRDENNKLTVAYSGGTLFAVTTAGRIEAGVGDNNLAIGQDTLLSETGQDNVAVGPFSLRDSTGTTARGNVAVGYFCLPRNTTGHSNIALGRAVLQNNDIGYYNIGIGEARTLAGCTSGHANIGIGASALSAVSTGSYNIGIGNSAGRSITTGINNIAIGPGAGESVTGNYNIAIGAGAIYNLVDNETSGDGNVAVGVNGLNTLITGNNNSALGYNAGNAANVDNTTCLGANSTVTGSNQLKLGSSDVTSYSYGPVEELSDIRDKTDIRDTQLGLDFVNSLRPVDFKWDYREDYRAKAPESVSKPAELKEDASDEDKAKYAEELSAYEAYVVLINKWIEDNKLANITHDGSKKRGRFHHGLIAQEVKAVLDAKGIDFGGFHDHKVNGGDDVLSIGYGELIAPLIKAVQQLSEQNKSLEAQNQAFEARLAALEAK